jgi:hypothetical protein
MIPLPPIVQESYTREQKRYIAGYLLWMRAGTLAALESVSSPLASVMPEWQRKQVRYYQDAEAYSRYLLAEIGYDVGKNQGWNPNYVP